jgi:ABC-type dipeptide/oligopeptide/nickel transport system permease component
LLSYIIRRLLLMIPTLIGVTAVVFFTMGLSPGGVGGTLLSLEGEADSETIRALREYYNQRYHLDEPLITQYGMWLNRVSPIGWQTNDAGELVGLPTIKAPDLGRAFSKGRNVTELYAEALPITITLNLITIPIIYSIAIITGIYAARYRGQWFDVTTGTTFLGLWSIPAIWAAVLMIGFLANRDYLLWFPTGGINSTLAGEMPFLPRLDDNGFVRGWLLDRLWHLVLPVACLTYAGFAFLSKLMRGAVLENLSADYVRTARAKGVGEREVLWGHVFRNSLLPLITVAAGIIPGLLAGSVIVESIFSIPGMGKLTIDAIYARDRELVLAGALIGGLLGLGAQILRDVAYAIADPRVSYE